MFFTMLQTYDLEFLKPQFVSCIYQMTIICVFSSKQASHSAIDHLLFPFLNLIPDFTSNVALLYFLVEEKLKNADSLFNKNFFSYILTT